MTIYIYILRLSENCKQEAVLAQRIADVVNKHSK